MSRESMRLALAATLTEVGVAVPRGATVENLVGVACTLIESQARMAKQLHDRHNALHAALRESLISLGRDPGAHALVAEMAEELFHLAQGKVIP